MHDIRQFRPMLYLLVLLGITGFGIAAEAPGLWVLATGAILLNAWLVRTGRFVPLRRWLANVITLGLFAVVFMQVRGDHDTQIIAIGQGLVLLQIVKFYEQRANRDYAQLLILSFLLMVSASISTASLVFGICFIIFLFLSLYCCLLFHLKVETDEVRANSVTDDPPTNPASVRLQQEFLPRSMRKVSVFMALFAVVMAVVVFVFCPRGSGEGMLAAMQMHGQAMTGFSENVSFQKVAQIARNEDVVARLELLDRGVPVTTPGPLLLRGSTLDIYNGDGMGLESRWSWKRQQPYYDENAPIDMVPGEPAKLFTGAEEDAEFTQKITLQPTGTLAIFAMAGASTLTVNRDLRVLYLPRDGVVRSAIENLRTPLEYTVVSTGRIPASVTPNEIAGRRNGSQIDPAIPKFALNPEVCGADPSGRALAEFPLHDSNPGFDRQIADHFQMYLRSHYRYTLDLTDLGSIGDRDPMVAFLTDFKAGHCEYFAGAMTLMCQSVNIPARVVVGFSCNGDDFNTLGNYYIVKQSNAHAWCEVYFDKQWHTYDPTAAENDVKFAAPGYKAKIKDFFDFLEFKWASSIVAYGNNDQHNLMDNLDNQMTRAAVDGSQGMYFWPMRLSLFFRRLDSWWQGRVWSVSSTVLGAAIVLVLGAMAAALVWFFVERWIMRRRARRIGLIALSSSDQLRLARQLAFYDELIQILERRKIVRPLHLTPMEFSRSLAWLPAGVYQDVHRLTELFYFVRYGNRTLSAHRQRWLLTVIHRIQNGLEILLPDNPKYECHHFIHRR